MSTIYKNLSDNSGMIYSFPRKDILVERLNKYRQEIGSLSTTLEKVNEFVAEFFANTEKVAQGLYVGTGTVLNNFQKEYPSTQLIAIILPELLIESIVDSLIYSCEEQQTITNEEKELHPSPPISEDLSANSGVRESSWSTQESLSGTPRRAGSEQGSAAPNPFMAYLQATQPNPRASEIDLLSEIAGRAGSEQDSAALNSVMAYLQETQPNPRASEIDLLSEMTRRVGFEHDFSRMSEEKHSLP